MRVILIEDEESLNIALGIFLKSQGFEVYSFSTLGDFFDKYKKIMPELIISDISLPDGNFLEELDNHPDLSYVKVLIISGNTDIHSIKKAFNLGAEDFIKKPFDYEELTIRINKIFKEHKSKIHIEDDLYYDTTSKSIINKENIVELSKKESLFLELLLKNRGKILNHKIIIDYLWDEPVSLNTLNVLVKRVREKLGKKNIIKTKRDLGYIIE